LLFGGGETEQGPAAQVLDPARLSRLYAHPVVRLDGPLGPMFAPR
jgi:hypothetical protein